jgi:hypothetical protein
MRDILTVSVGSKGLYPPAAPHESPTVRQVCQFVSEGKQCCRRDYLRHVWKSFRDDIQQFGDAVATCSLM